MRTYDAIVLGLGGMGSAALYHLAQRGARVCGVEQFAAGHDRGSSHGNVRVIRKAYFEHPDYVPLLEQAYTLWRGLEATTAEQGNEADDGRLLVQNGLLLSAPQESGTVQGLEACYESHSLPHWRLTAADAMARYPQFRLPPDHAVFFDPQGGYLYVECCVHAHLAAARRLGAEVMERTPVTHWEADNGDVVVRTAGDTLHAERLVITAGPWAGRALRGLGLGLTLRRKMQLWYTSPNIAAYSGLDFPCFYVATSRGDFYGFPALDARGIKVAEHSGGDAVPDPDTLEREVLAEEDSAAMRFLIQTFPGFTPSRTAHSACIYTMTPDEHFIVDRHPEHGQVSLAAGFSGHGFKFAPVMGEVLAQLALDGSSSHPISFLSLRRFVES